MSTDIFRELDEDLRQQKLEQVWKKHSRAIITTVVVLVVGVAAYTFWQDKYTGKLEQATSALTTVLQQIKPDNRADTLAALDKLANSSPTGQAVIARLYAAALAADDGKTAEAVAALEAISNDDSVAPLYRDYAKVLSVYHQLDTGDAVALQNTLSPLKGEGKAWRFAAEELSALISLKQGDRDSGKAALERLQADVDAPTGMRERATRILATLNTDS
jgi:hypothetical protein